MSQSSHLKIYNSAMFLLRDFYERVPKFSKQYKYILGEKMISCVVEIIMLITKANNERMDKRRVLIIEEIINKTDELFVYVRIAEELKQFNSSSAYSYLIEKITDISKQSTGWRKIYIPQNF